MIEVNLTFHSIYAYPKWGQHYKNAYLGLASWAIFLMISDMLVQP
jgi:hypothetical protein